ncbi:MAG: hypothetical protein ABW136_04630 [Steroidobacteraceae bacterium]
MKLHTAILLAALAICAGCANTESRDEFLDKRAEFRRAAIACGSNMDCLRNVKTAEKNAKP